MDKEIQDEFEFKPLTEGLGFHKKTLDLRDDVMSNSDLTSKLKTGILPQSKRTDRPAAAPAGFTKPLVNTPQKIQKPLTTTVPAPAGWQPALGNATLDELRPSKQTQKPITAATSLEFQFVNWPAAFFDTTMVLGLGLLFSAVVFALTGIDTSELAQMITSDPGVQVASFVLLIAVLEIYAVSCRSFFGKTLGEWAFESRLGTPEQQQQATYPLRVAWRTLAVALTGFIVLPLLSYLIKRDLAGVISGLQLYAEKR